MNKLFPLSAVDLYKPGHATMYHPLTEVIFSNFTPRGDKHFPHYAPNAPKGVIVAGIQRMIKFVLGEMWEDFFKMPEDQAVRKFTRRMDGALGRGVVSGEGVRKLHQLGYLPLEFRSQDEGVLSPLKVPVFTIHNTHKDFAWLTNYLETVISAESWKTMTSATTAFNFRLLAEQYAGFTCDNKDHIPFQMHDFSLRGLSNVEDGYKSGIGHLFSFLGTDNVPAIECLEDHYNSLFNRDNVPAFSVPATEHSVACTNINKNIKDTFDALKSIGASHAMNKDDSRFWAEVKFMERYLTKIVPTGIASYVADSYDYERIITEGAKALKDVIMARDGSLIFRPDTGNPVEVICGIPYVDGTENLESVMWDLSFGDEESPPQVVLTKEGFYKFDLNLKWEYGEWEYEGFTLGEKLSKEQVKGSIETLWDIFGGTVNSKGYKELDPHVGLIYGDSITMDRAKEIFKRLQEKGFASNNIVLGVGSYVYGMVSRDTFGFAMKSTGTIIDGESIAVSKDPKTDPGKKSANGFLKVVEDSNGDLELVESEDLSIVDDEDNTLLIRFRNGEFYNEVDLTHVRGNVSKEVEKSLNE